MNKKFSLSIVFSLLLVFVLSVTAFSYNGAGSWVQEGTNWKYAKSDGSFVVNDWVLAKNGDTYSNYYMDENGFMCVGIKKIGNDYYSFNYDGSANSRANVNVLGKIYQTGKLGVLKNVYGAIDVNAYNAQFLAEKAAYEANKATIDAEAAAKAEAEALKAIENAAIDERNEKMGPKGKGAAKKNDGGPGFAN